MKALRIILLLPFSLIYSLGAFIRNKLFDWSLLKEKSFNKPVISMGNLSVGGTGKTPHVEYVIALLKDKFKVATLSRGYGRETKGYREVTSTANFLEVGDEPVQFAAKFPDVKVAVCEDRVIGISNLIATDNPDVIILDDAYQHRYVKPGLNILLTDFYRLYSDDFIMPSGTLREPRSGSKRADIIIVTKTDPTVFSPIIKKIMLKKLKICSYQRLYFSYIKYQTPVSLFNSTKFLTEHVTTLFLITGIANPYPFQEHVKKHCSEMYHFIYKDHHSFTKKEISRIIDDFNRHLSTKKAIIMTEKDAKRLIINPFRSMLINLPVYYVPINIALHQHESFDLTIKNFVEQFPKV
ncbi:MAG: tetraacyldisaccharide 4'-kinase [Bacteroidales bacterium]|jgi:tetraacyldisaccharide 4'-kinase|nr:tetraacyldisaccharide 4'-kinase [Bacteroidales bacterium]